MGERCPTCGASVRVYSGGEGTNSYELDVPPAEALEKAANMIEVCHGRQDVVDWLRKLSGEVYGIHHAKNRG
jgi:hypothetical protein